MKITLVMAALFVVCSSTFAVDLTKVDNLVREFREFEADQEMQRAIGRCHVDADVIFVLDRSNSIHSDDFKMGKQFIREVIMDFDPTKTRFAAISYAEGATVEFGLDTYHDQDTVLKSIQSIRQDGRTGTSTDTWAALALVYKRVLARRNQRTGAVQTVLLLTDGGSQDPRRSAAEAEIARSWGIDIFAIGVGSSSGMESELNAIAPGHVHMVDDYFNSLHAIRSQVATEMCSPYQTG